MMEDGAGGGPSSWAVIQLNGCKEISRVGPPSRASYPEPISVWVPVIVVLFTNLPGRREDPAHQRIGACVDSREQLRGALGNIARREIWERFIPTNR